MKRQLFEVKVEYGLFLASGGQAPGLQSKTWFFDVPGGAPEADAEYWVELIHRIFYDANCAMRLREPGDHNWLGAVNVSTLERDPSTMLAWDGKPSQEAILTYFPWMKSVQEVVWEYGAAYYVDEQGNYDCMPAPDFTELLMNHLVDAGQVGEAEFCRFFLAFLAIPDEEGAREMWNNRHKRLANLAVIRPTPLPRKTPGTRPYQSGPIAV
jgi:hypothetical protein